MSYILAFIEPSSDCMTNKNIIWTFPDYELSLNTSLVMVDRHGAANNCVRHINTTTIHI